MTDFTVVVTEQSYPSGVAACVDLLAAAQDEARRSDAPIPSFRVASELGGVVRLRGAFSVDTQVLARARDHSTWILPALATYGRAASPQGELALLEEALADHVESGGHVAASSSSIFLLERAGVLEGRRFCASAEHAKLLRARRPSAMADCEKMLCVDGPLTTCSAAFRQCDLVLHLINQLCGPSFAEALARTWLQPFEASFPLSNLLPSHEARDVLVARLVQKIDSSLPEAPSVSELARDLCISERTLSRYVHSVTGKSTRALIQDVKLRRARTLLERSRLSVEKVAAAVGYSDSTALRRLIRRETGARPSRFRMARLPASN